MSWFRFLQDVRRLALGSIAVGVLLALPSLLQAEPLRRIAPDRHDLDRTRPVDVVHGDDFTPLRGTGPLLAGSDDPRLGVMPGVAWTPGLPGGGGGSGGPWEPAVADGYTVETVLPCLASETACVVSAASAEGTYLVGQSDIGSQDLHPCLSSTGEPVFRESRHAVVWELDSTASLVELHDLPNSVPADGHDRVRAWAVNDSGLVVGDSFLRWFTDDCDAPGKFGWQWRAVIWRRGVGGTWQQHDLPTSTGRAAVGQARGVNNAGWVVGLLGIDADDDGENEGGGPVVWIPDSSETSGWRLEWLPLPGSAETVHAYLINDTGTIAGYATTTEADGSRGRLPLAWQRSRSGRWLLTELSTLGGDSAFPSFLTEDGQLVGSSSSGVIEPGQGNDGDTEHEHAARWVRNPTSGTWSGPEDLGTLGGYLSSAHGQVGSELIIGSSTINTRDQNEKRAVVWDGGGPVQLDAITEGRWTFHGGLEVLPSGHLVVIGQEGNSEVSQRVILAPNAP